MAPVLPRRQSLKRGQAVGDVMESLLVDGVDRHLRLAEKSWIVERADFQDHGRQSRPPRDEVRAAFAAEFPRHGAFKIAAGKLPGRSLGVAKAAGRHENKHVGRAAGDILAFAAMALRPQYRLALGEVAHRATIATAVQRHRPCFPVYDRGRRLRAASLSKFAVGRLVAGNAPATTARARGDPAWATAAAARSSVTRRQRDDRGGVLQRMETCGSVLLVLRTGLHGHGAQHDAAAVKVIVSFRIGTSPGCEGLRNFDGNARQQQHSHCTPCRANVQRSRRRFALPARHGPTKSGRRQCDLFQWWRALD